MVYGTTDRTNEQNAICLKEHNWPSTLFAAMSQSFRLSFKNVFVLLAMASVSVLVTGCSESNNSEPCEKTATCKPVGSAGSSSETGGTGGKSSTGGASGTHKGGTGGIASASSSTGGKAGASTTAPCSGACTGTKPICDTDKNECVECTKKEDCTGDATKPVCNTTKGACVACNENNDCKDATASRCDTSTNTCSACSIDDDCEQIDGKGICSVGVCVQCTVANEKACSSGANSCNPKTNSCTGTAKGSVDICRSCLADSECIGENTASPTVRCVPMTFGANLVSHGSYCLQRRASVACASPFAVLMSSASVSGATAEDYCAVSQAATTCEAVLDMIAAKTCTGDDAQCGNGGGLCKQSASTGDLRCTIPCGMATECTGSLMCNLPTTPYCH